MTDRWRGHGRALYAGRADEQKMVNAAALKALMDEWETFYRALDFIAADATITPEGCPEPWRSTLIEWAKAADRALRGES